MRSRAATDFSTNLVVLAGAGTGKTSLLVERMLVAIGSGTIALPRLAAITFTEKAAGEMHERLALGLSRLHARAGGEVEHDDAEAADRAFGFLSERGCASHEVAAHALAAFDALPAATLTTIHGFCARILRAFPREAGLPPGFAVDAVKESDLVFDELWAAFLERELGPQGTRIAAWDAALADLPLDALAAMARGLAQPTLPEELLRESYAGADLRDLFAAEAAELGAQARAHGGTHSHTLAEGCDALATDGVPGLRAFFDRHPGFETVLRKGHFAEPLKPARSLLRDLCSVDESGFAAAHALLASFALEVRATRRSRGIVSFDELLAATARLLREHPEVRRSLRERYPMLLVDEFQDTDPLQYEIVLLLSQRPDTSADDPYQADLEPGRLFLVGDPKQSVYRFRGADYGSLARAIDRVKACGGEVLHLEENWRSVEEVLDPVHAVFREPGSTIWKTEEGFQPAYLPLRAARGLGGGGPRVEIWSVREREPGPLSAEDRRRAEGRVLARAIVEGERAGSFRLKDVTILMRAFVYLRDLLRPLREAGIPFVVSGGHEFLERPEVVSTLAVLRAVAHAGDAAALLAYLRSPAGGVPDVELAAFAADGGSWHGTQRPDGRRFPLLARALQRLRALQEETRGLPADAAVRRVLSSAGILTLHACAFEGAQRVANLRKLASTAAELGRDGRRSLLEILDAIEEQRGSDPEGESPLADEGMNAVRILTVHAAKGLEGKVVFVPDMVALRRWEPPPIQPGVGIARFPEGSRLAYSASRRQSVAAAWQTRQNHKHDDAEDARLLYVALTRARERLVLLCGASRGQGPWSAALAAWGYRGASPPEDEARLLDGRVLHRVCVDTEGPLPALIAPALAGDAGRIAAHEARVAALNAAATPPLRVPSALGEERVWPEHQAEQDEVEGLDRSTARAVGTAVHRVLEGWPEAAAPRRQAAAARVAAHAVAADPRPVERETAAILTAFGRSPLAARLQAVEVLGREVPVLLQDGLTAWRGTLDLLYRDGEEIVVADYKTDKDEDEEILRARYAGQLDVYARAVAEALRLPCLPRRELWLLRTGRVVACGDRQST